MLCVLCRLACYHKQAVVNLWWLTKKKKKKQGSLPDGYLRFLGVFRSQIASFYGFQVLLVLVLFVDPRIGDARPRRSSRRIYRASISYDPSVFPSHAHRFGHEILVCDAFLPPVDVGRRQDHTLHVVRGSFTISVGLDIRAHAQRYSGYAVRVVHVELIIRGATVFSGSHVVGGTTDPYVLENMSHALYMLGDEILFIIKNP